jgi:hypothetical protein
MFTVRAEWWLRTIANTPMWSRRPRQLWSGRTSGFMAAMVIMATMDTMGIGIMAMATMDTTAAGIDGIESLLRGREGILALII